MKLMLATFGLIAWLLAVIFGTLNLAKYQNQPGRDAAPPAQVDFQTAQIKFDGSKPTLILFAHPKCPCTRATLMELSDLMTKFGSRVSVHVLFYQPSEEPADWSRTDVWKQAAEMPGLRVTADVDGAEAKRFGAHTSGQVLLYSPTGKLVFKGGITAGRGHVGTNPGVEAIAEYLENGVDANVKSASVFGCIIDSDESDS